MGFNFSNVVAVGSLATDHSNRKMENIYFTKNFLLKIVLTLYYTNDFAIRCYYS